MNWFALAQAHGTTGGALRDITTGPGNRALVRYGMRPTSESAKARDLREEVAGYRLGVVNRDLVMVGIAVRTNVNDNALVSMTIPMRWQDGDWKAVLEDRDPPVAVAGVADLTGFTGWSPA